MKLIRILSLSAFMFAFMGIVPAGCSATIAPHATPTAVVAPAAVRTPSVSSGDYSLVTAPSTSGINTIENAIRDAKSSVRLVMYELSDKTAERNLVADHKRGVNVQVLLNGGYYGAGFPQNKSAYTYLKDAGVPVKWTPSYFALTHQKTLVVDGRTAYIMTLNLTSTYYSTSRDFAVRDSNPTDVAAILKTFNADWTGTKLPSQNGADLVWSPGALSETLALVNSAKSSIDIYNEEMDDSQVTDALAAAAKRGVDVKVVMTYQSSWKSAFEKLADAGVHVRTYSSYASLYIHAKMILVDSKRVFLGSQNFSAGSLKDNRELGIVLTNPNIIRSLAGTFNSDYAGARAFYD